MEISPVYGDGSPMSFDAPTVAIVAPMLSQHARFRELLNSLSEQQWTSPSRCAGWSVQDVVTHLVGTNGFWAASIAGGLSGTPTRYLVGFDPKATPASMVEAQAGTDVKATFEGFVQSSEQLCALVGPLTAEQLTLRAEAPPGHLPIHSVLHHAIWDAWVHERDVALPLGLEHVIDPDEVVACLRYAPMLTAMFAALNQPDRTGSIAVTATDPSIEFTVTAAGTATLSEGISATADASVTGSAAELIDAFSVRGPFPSGVDESVRWITEGLETAFS